MNNPNHPLYSALGGGSNIHLLDNMLFTAEQHKPILNSQYVYSNMEQLAAHQHAMNLAVSEQSHHVAAAVAATTIDSSALLYHHPSEHHQQQPISYKIPQVSKKRNGIVWKEVKLVIEILKMSVQHFCVRLSSHYLVGQEICCTSIPSF